MDNNYRPYNTIKFALPFPTMDREDRKNSKMNILKSNTSDEIWIFGYGSLMWDPRIKFLEKMAGTLLGYHRDFCVWTQLARGSAQMPGLGLGLESGGSCKGVLFKIDPKFAETELQKVWERELYTAVYNPIWGKVSSSKKSIRAISFITNKNHMQYCGEMNLRDRAYYIRSATGKNGPCIEYLKNTIMYLAKSGSNDAYLNQLLEEVDKTSN